jgi:hypothetical protein
MTPAVHLQTTPSPALRFCGWPALLRFAHIHMAAFQPPVGFHDSEPSWKMLLVCDQQVAIRLLSSGGRYVALVCSTGFHICLPVASNICFGYSPDCLAAPQSSDRGTHGVVPSLIL